MPREVKRTAPKGRCSTTEHERTAAVRWIGANVYAWQEVFLNQSAFLSEKPFKRLSGMS